MPQNSLKCGTAEEIIKQKPTSDFSRWRQRSPVTLNRTGRKPWQRCGQRGPVERREAWRTGGIQWQEDRTVNEGEARAALGRVAVLEGY